MEDLNIKQLTLAVRTIAEEKNLPEETVLSVIEQAIAAAWRRDNGERDQDVRAELNVNDGTAKVFVQREVVELVGSDAVEISLEDAQKAKSDAKLGDVIEEEHEVTSFGRVAAQTAKQVVLQRLREAEREVVLEEFEDKIGTVVTGIVQRVEPRVVRIELGKATGILPQSEQIQGEFYSVGSRTKVIIKDIDGVDGPAADPVHQATADNLHLGQFRHAGYCAATEVAPVLDASWAPAPESTRHASAAASCSASFLECPDPLP